MSKPAAAQHQPSFPQLIQEFFTEHLVSQRAVSACTVACYRDAMMLFLDFAGHQLNKIPTQLKLVDLQPELILAFLKYLEQERHNTVRSRNLRLTALRTFLKFVARRDITVLSVMERALAVPTKRFERPILGFLTREEVQAVIGPPGSSWTAQRDRLLFVLLYNTGARVSEITRVKVVDIVLDDGACVHLHGKGRKLRSVPLWKTTVLEIRAWLRQNPGLSGESALLPNRDGQAMCRSNVNKRLNLAVTRATAQQPSIGTKSVSPHTLRHSTAMHLLQSGVPFNVIALWLGHESVNTTHRYVEADLAMKEKALARLAEPDGYESRFQAPDPLMQFLQTL